MWVPQCRDLSLQSLSLDCLTWDQPVDGFVLPDPLASGPVIQVANPLILFQETDPGPGLGSTGWFADSLSSQQLCPPPTNRPHLLGFG